MNRRTFSQLMTGGVLSTQMLKAGSANANIFSLNYAPHFGMFEQHAGKDYIDQLKSMHEMGFRALEDNEMMEKPVEVQEKIVALS